MAKDEYLNDIDMRAIISQQLDLFGQFHCELNDAVARYDESIFDINVSNSELDSLWKKFVFAQKKHDSHCRALVMNLFLNRNLFDL